MLNAARKQHPNDGDIIMGLLSYNKAIGKTKEARRYAELLAKMDPRNGTVDELMRP